MNRSKATGHSCRPSAVSRQLSAFRASRCIRKWLFVRAGVPLERTWQYATARAAATLPVPALGRLEPGAPADLAIFREDPTANVEALKTLEAVAIQGRLYMRSDLDAALARYL